MTYIRLFGERIKLCCKFSFEDNYLIFDILDIGETKLDLDMLSNDEIMEVIEYYFKDYIDGKKWGLLIYWLIKNNKLEKEQLEELKWGKDIVTNEINISKISYFPIDALLIKPLTKHYIINEKSENELYKKILNILIQLLVTHDYTNLNKDIIKKLTTAVNEIFDNENCFNDKFIFKLEKYFNDEDLLFTDYIDDYDCFAIKFVLKLNYISKNEIKKLKNKMSKQELCEYILENYIKKNKEKFIKDVMYKYFKNFRTFIDEYAVEMDDEINKLKHPFDLFFMFRRIFNHDCIVDTIKKHIKKDDILRIKNIDTIKQNNQIFYIYEIKN